MTLEIPDDNGNDNAQITGASPGLRLVGTETSGGDLGLHEDAGTLSAWDFGAGAETGLSVASLTDGAGVAHSGELADASDVSGKGSDTQSGDGTTTTFTVSHGLGSTPAQVVVTPTSAAADGAHYVTNKTSTSFDIVYATAPATGTSNLSWDFMAF